MLDYEVSIKNRFTKGSLKYVSRLYYIGPQAKKAAINVLNDFNSLKEHLNNAKVIINLIGEIKNESMMKRTNFFFLKKL